MKYPAIAATMALLLSSSAQAAGSADTKLGIASATIVEPIALVHFPGSSLNFGRFVVGSSGTVVVTPAGAQSTTGGVANTSGGSASADLFVIVGEPNRSFTIATASSNIAAPSGATLAFTTLPSATSGELGGVGIAIFSVGGTLTVPLSAPAATYTGTYSATVSYN